MMDALSLVNGRRSLLVRQFAAFDPEAYRERLRLLRLYYGDNQVEFAARLGVPFKRWNHYERGYPITRETAFLLAEKLGISPEWVWWGVEYNMSQGMLNRLHELEREERKKGSPKVGEPVRKPRRKRKKRANRRDGALPTVLA